MGIINRFLLFVYAGVVLLVTLFLAIFLMKSVPIGVLSNEIEFLMGQGVTLNALLCFAACSAYFLLYAFFVGEKKKVEEVQEDCVRIRTEKGEVRISKDAVASLTDREAMSVSGVRESSTVVEGSLKEGEAAVSLNMELILTAGASVPEITSTVKEAVQNRIKDSLGVENAPVEISVRELSNAPSENQRRVH
ncbi:MAG: alkaline shock response membrane anchor protein AmaP [Selenomonadaceae bacterium]|nr:alkaline shock response membrane anchor protein AmaP [Selenomonadaceae bacterium]